MNKIIISTLMAGLTLTGCTTTGNVEEKAAIGAAAGAVAGAVLGNNTGDGDARTGAIIGAVVGAAGGAYVGHQQDKEQGEETEFRQGADGQALIYDGYAERYYFVDERTGKTYWRNGELRSTPY